MSIEDSTMDFVIPWVDGNNREWREQYIHYKKKEEGDAREARFRDWENLQYWFRGVEKFAPWVDKIHFVTWGHLPNWLNTNHPKLNIVKHTDFIPDKYLPTFNSRVIALNVHRINNLSDKYLYFNDDMFFINRVSKEHFFRNDKPCGMAIPTILTGKPYSFTLLKNISIINKHFSKYEAIKRKPFKWFNFKYGLMGNIRALLLLPWSRHTGFSKPHLPYPSLKRTLELIWEKEYPILNDACLKKFRDYSSANAFVQGDWELASNNFYPINFYSFGQYFNLHEVKVSKVTSTIRKQSKKIICFNDQEISNFDAVKTKINASFGKILPEKSSFET